MFSLTLLLPFGGGALTDRSLSPLFDVAGYPAKHVTLVRSGTRETIETRTVTIDDFLTEQGLTRQPADRTTPQGPLEDAAEVDYRPAGDIRIVVDGAGRTVRTAAQTVGELLAEQHLGMGAHDSVTPALGSALQAQTVITVTRATSWLERIESTIVAPVRHRFDVTMMRGTQRVVDPGSAGTRETTVAVVRSNGRAAARVSIADRILRLPRARVVAEGVADAASLGAIARRGFLGTLKLADAALRMVATAYTASCSGCSGLTASGKPAGHGVVAVDPHYIPLGTHLFIPGYGHALAGDTGGSIHGNRIDLGFDTHRDALTFGRRAVIVYVLK